MDRIARRLKEILHPYFGDAGLLLVLREMKYLKLEPPINELYKRERALLVENIAEHLLQPVLSSRRLSMFRSELYYACEVSRMAEMLNKGEGAKWTG